MTGVNVDQWRGSIGLFNRRNISKKYLGAANLTMAFELASMFIVCCNYGTVLWKYCLVFYYYFLTVRCLCRCFLLLF